MPATRFVLGANGGAEGDSFIWAQSLPDLSGAVLQRRRGRGDLRRRTRLAPQAKSPQHAGQFPGLPPSAAPGEHEGLLQSRSTIKEGSSSNLFVVCDGRLPTPPPEEVLAGVTADIVLALATQASKSSPPLAESEICALG
ncbi:aminotransferase class IV [Candidatus Amarolinea dominans]|uniref:aminotransferase class IV n=1 Tax=Candidatus Amarolinea dominans TaxID=3140696 RepID=UPI003134E968|nr:aminotransferase class IV [Anaerolineae bacterium]